MSLLSEAAAEEDGDIIQALRAENDALKQQLMAATKSALDHVQRNRDLEALLEAVGAGGVGPLMPRKLTQQDIADGALLGNIESPFNACMHQENCKRWKAQADQQHQRKLSNDNDLQRENGQLSTSSSTAPAGWKLVPMEPTIKMISEGSCAATLPGPRYIDESAAKKCWAYMLTAAPQPPAVGQPNVDPCKDGSCDCCWTDKPQPQGEQEPVAVIGDVWTLNWVGGDPIATIVKKHGLKIGDKLYTYQKPKRAHGIGGDA